MHQKRKRNDRGSSDSGPPRPSPHRPQESSMNQHERSFDGGRNSRGGGGGGGGGRNNQRRDHNRRDSSQSYPSAPPSSSSAQGPTSPSFPRPSSASSQNPPPPVATKPAPAASAVPSASTPAPRPATPAPTNPCYEYTIITDSRIKRWSQDQRQFVVSHGIQSREDEDLTEVATIFQELIHSVAEGRLRGADAGGVVKEILGREPSEEERAALSFDPHVLFLDMVCTYVDVEAGALQPQFAEFMMATEISPTLMRLILDPPILQYLDLIRDTFVRMGIRQSTNLLYRQASYNLLREETEGFSKLITGVFTTCTSEGASAEVVQDTFNKVMGLIGTFDLHPGRVLDVTLDVFAAILVKQFRFFVKFLRVSSWWPRSQIRKTDAFLGGLPLWALPDHPGYPNTPEEDALVTEQQLARDIAFWERARDIKLDAYFELGGRRLTAVDEELLTNAANESATEIEKEWIRITKTLPPSGNRDAAQMLGFKLRFYTSEARDPEDTLPANLLYLSALLIKIGFISLTDLWNHIWPPNEDMEEVRTEKMKELEEKERASRPGAAKNALMTAGALPDDMPPPTNNSSRRDNTANKPDVDMKDSASAEEKSKLPKPDDQKVHLLKCLLTIGALPEALFIIGQYDWVLQAFPDIIPLLHRILHHSIDAVYQQSRPRPATMTECPPKSVPDLDQSGVPKGSIRSNPPAPRRPLRWPHPDTRETQEGGHYRFYWDEWADNVPVCQTVDDLFTLFDTLLNIVGVNIGLDAPLMTKITTIGAKSLADDQSPANVARWLEILKRLLVPALSLGEANSAVADSVWALLKQYSIRTRYNIYAELYEGSISRLEPIRKAFARTKLETLAKLKRLSLTNIPEMAKSLAKIAYPSPGVVCKVSLMQIESYSNFIEAFVECTKYFTDLGYDVLVWSVLSSLGGQQRSRTQEDSVLLTSRWLQALSRFSGKVFTRYSNMDPSPILQYVHAQLLQGNSTDLVILKELVMSMGGVVSDLDFTDAQLRAMTGGELLRRETLINLGDKRAASARSAERLMRALTSSKLAGQLLINIAQYRQNAIYAEDGSAHIKYLATIVDDTHQVLLQYLDLLQSNLDVDTFHALVPDVIRLMKDFGLEANLAFLIRRSSIRWEVKTPSSAKDSPTQSKSVADGDGDVAMDASNVDESNAEGEADATSKVPESLTEALTPLIEEIPSVLPNQSWRYISPACYVFFWSLQLGNLVFPQDSYSVENARLKKQAEEVMRDRSDMTRAGMNKKTQKRDEILDRQKLLLQEANEGITRFSKAKLHIGRQIGTWFPADISKANAAADALLEECILPRLQLSALDAEYCFRMVKFLHEFSTPNFKLMSLYDRLFNHNRLRAIIFTCTVREAEHLGRFLQYVLGDLSRWHGDKTAYEKEALGLKEVNKTRQYLGFATAFDGDGKPTEFVEHEAFQELLFKWHKELNTALRSCLNGMEWMHIRNAVTVLKSVIDFFPAINFMADKFLEQLKTITEREGASKNAPESEHAHRVDLSVTAQTAYSELQRRKPKWILVQAFRPGVKGDATLTNSSLRGSAPEFKAGLTRAQQAEVEDGEVKDSKTAKETGSGRPRDREPREREPREREPREREARDKETSLPRPPTRETLRENNNSLPPRSSSTNNQTGKSSNSRSTPVTSTPNSGGRTEQPKFSTLPPGGHGLPNKPMVNLPVRPDVPFPRGGNERPGQSGRHDRREPGSRDGRDYSRDGREPRDAHPPHPPHGTNSAHGPLPSHVPHQPHQPHPSHPRDSREGRDSRDPRDPRDPVIARDSRDYRTPESSRPERPRDFPSSGRSADAGPRDVGRPSERDWPSRGEAPPRWNDHATAPERDTRPPREKGSRHEPRAPKESAGAPQAPPASQVASIEPPTHPDRARVMAEADRPDMINPARAALINDGRDSSSRSGSRDHRERPTRTESPRRTDHPTSTAPPPEGGREDRPGRHRHSDHHSASRDSLAENPPSQPRQDRNPERDDRVVGPKDSSFGGPSRSDQDHGRLNQQDPNYGRLNPIQSIVDMPQQGPPSGPRGRGGRNTARVPTGPSGANNGPHGPNAPSMRPDNRPSGPSKPEPIRPPSPERHPPTGPSAGRNNRSQRNAYDKVNSPTTPAAPPTGPASGMHPDRMRHISHQQPSHQQQQQQQQPQPSGVSSLPPPPPPPTGPAAGIHPDRLNQISGTPTGPGSHSRPPMNTPDRPHMSTPSSGPRPTPPNINTDFSTPTGPAAGHDRMRPGGRQLRGIQSMLDKASMDNSRGPQLRMSRSRPNLAGSDAQILTGSSPVTTPVQERPDPIPRDSGRRDMSTDRLSRGTEAIQVVGDSRDPRGGANGEEFGATRSEHERSRRDHHRTDRSNRASRRNSPERGAGPDREREPKEPRDYRDRRSGVSSSTTPGGGRDDRDPNSSRRSGRDSASGNRDSLPGGSRDMPAPPPRDSSHRNHRAEGPSGPRSDIVQGPRNEGHGGRGDVVGRSEDYSGRTGPPRGNPQSRDSRSRQGGGDERGDDRVRKRRSEGIVDPNSSHQDKRLRRG
ncbi:transcription factor/nuclear export subunit protein 2-domain-containing protein [Podospora australis]|uniref:THO complex subunit 2 n=1 Tax=Podospora australis TaxID=1536484 RepID=A0AAN7ANA8_9PEZI|nr:transcription factor/nuclear export subunit protein 2-domain-containing protein [Podospora australis]